MYITKLSDCKFLMERCDVSSPLIKKQNIDKKPWFGWLKCKFLMERSDGGKVSKCWSNLCHGKQDSHTGWNHNFQHHHHHQNVGHRYHHHHQNIHHHHRQKYHHQKYLYDQNIHVYHPYHHSNAAAWNHHDHKQQKHQYDQSIHDYWNPSFNIICKQDFHWIHKLYATSKIFMVCVVKMTTNYLLTKREVSESC